MKNKASQSTTTRSQTATEATCPNCAGEGFVWVTENDSPGYGRTDVRVICDTCHPRSRVPLIVSMVIVGLIFVGMIVIGVWLS